MEKSVNGIRGRFYHDLKKNYREQREQSFLFRAFWAEGVRELLKEYLPPLPKENELRKLLRILKKQFLELLPDTEDGGENPEELYIRLPGNVQELLRVHLPQLPEEVGQQLKEHFAQLPKELRDLLEERFPWLLEDESRWFGYESRIRELLRETIRKRPEWAKSMMQKAAPGERRERRDFWKELWLHDAGHEEGLIPDREYYLWLLEYLAARSIYYNVYYYYNDSRKDRDRNLDESIMEDGREWMYEFLRAGPGKTSEPGRLSITQVGEELKELAGRLRGPDWEKTIGTLRGLKHREGRAGEEDYLRWLTSKLKQRAIHIRIRNWLQDSGYPLGNENRTNRRKQDFSMRLFENFCDSEEGYDFSSKKDAGMGDAGDWKVEKGFCIWKPDHLENVLEELLEVLKRNRKKRFYLPLAVDLNSGCVFFLAGKAHYEDAYFKVDRKLREIYERREEFYCFDYLRLDKRYLARESPGDVGGAFRLRAAFHENAGKSYQSVLNDFKRYCEEGDVGESLYLDPDRSPRQKIRAVNRLKRPADIPETFQGVFGMAKPKPSQKAKDDLKRTRKKIEKDRLATCFV